MKKAYIWIYLLLLATYIILSFTLPADPKLLERLDLSPVGVRLLNLSFVVPITLIYLTALYGFIRMHDYANKVHKTKEGLGFHYFAQGLGVLALSLPIASVTGSLRSYIKHAQPYLLSDISIIRQYLALLMAFAAIYLLGKGARELYATLKRPQIESYDISSSLLIGPIAVASIYTWLIVNQQKGISGGEPYFLPTWLILCTLAVPYVLSWCIGIRAALQLQFYHNAVRGTVYKRALGNLSWGIATIVLVSVLIQFLTTISGFLNKLNMTPLLGVIYALLACYAVGFILVARGAHKLKHIEEV